MDFRRQVKKSFESITAGSSYAIAVEKPKRGPLKRPAPTDTSFGGAYKCHKCLKGFTTKKDVTFHLTKGTCHFKCPECPLIFGKQAFFDYHMKSEHTPIVENITIEEIVEGKDDVVIVEQATQPPAPAPEIEVVKVEMMDYSDKVVEEFQCVECDLIFATETSLTAHKIRKHNQKIEMFPCQVTKRRWSWFFRMKSLNCPFCPQLCTPVISFISQKALAAHTELLHPEPLKAVWEMIEQPEESELMDIYKNL
jgi:hypothetical protein